MVYFPQKSNAICFSLFVLKQKLKCTVEPMHLIISIKCYSRKNTGFGAK